MGALQPARSRTARGGARRAFTLAELVLVVAIIGVIAAIAVPRFGNLSKGATQNGVRATLTNVRTAIDLYSAEHGRYPGYNPANGAPDGTWFVDQLTLYSDARGNTSTTAAAPYIYGPYLRHPFPTNPRNKLNTVAVIPGPQSPQPAAGSTGWIAVLATGAFDVDAGGGAGTVAVELADPVLTIDESGG